MMYVGSRKVILFIVVVAVRPLHDVIKLRY